MSGFIGTATGLLAQLRPASFRGVAFGVMGAGKDGGRRIVTHLYPKRDKVQHEDMGRKQRILTVSMIVIGTGIAGRAARLEAALDKQGVGRLVHPLYGEVQVTCTGWKMSSGLESGMLSYEGTFEIYDGPKKTPSSSSGAGLMERLGLSSVAELVSDVSRMLSLEGLQEFVGENFGEEMAAVAEGLGVIAAGYGLYEQAMGALGSLSAWTGAGTPSASPALAAVTLTSKAVEALGTTGLRPDALLAVAAGGARPSIPAVALDTPSRRAEASNAVALDELVRASAAVTAARVGSSVEWDSRDEAIAYRDRVADALDDSADRIGALGLDAAWGSIVDLRAAWVRTVTEAAAPLPRVTTITPTAPVSSLMLAYQVDGDNLDLLFARGADITRRNQVAHPGFLPAGEALEVLSDV